MDRVNIKDDEVTKIFHRIVMIDTTKAWRLCNLNKAKVDLDKPFLLMTFDQWLGIDLWRNDRFAWKSSLNGGTIMGCGYRYTQEYHLTWYDSNGVIWQVMKSDGTQWYRGDDKKASSRTNDEGLNASKRLKFAAKLGIKPEFITPFDPLNEEGELQKDLELAETWDFVWTPISEITTCLETNHKKQSYDGKELVDTDTPVDGYWRMVRVPIDLDVKLANIAEQKRKEEELIRKLGGEDLKANVERVRAKRAAEAEKAKKKTTKKEKTLVSSK